MKKKYTILVVDDIDTNREVLKTFLKPMGYSVIEACDGQEALEIFIKETPDLILLDLKMPRMDGFEVCNILKSNPKTRMIPIIIITSHSDDEHHLKALEAGADDFLTKPFNMHFLKARLKSLLSVKVLHDMIMEYQETLKKSNVELMQTLITTQDVTIFSLAKLAEFRDPETGEHLERMREYSKILALEARKNPVYKNYINDQYLKNIYKSTPLHDIGKVGVPDNILLKPGKLTDKEFEIMKKHSAIGGDAISSAIKLTGKERYFLDMGRDIAYHHHEKWDGTGYPEGLKGETIPLSARITALADVYDALTTKRVYKPAFPHDKAKKIIVEGVETAFDPIIVDAFSRKESEFLRIKKEYQDKNDFPSS